MTPDRTAAPSRLRSHPRRTFAFGAVLASAAAAAALLGGCSTSSGSPGPASATGSSSGARSTSAPTNGSTVSTSGVTLRIGDQVHLDETLLSASGELKNLPFQIQWDEFSSGPPLLTALSSGNLDLGGVGDAPPVFAAASGESIKVVAASSEDGDRADAIVVPPGSHITSVAQLKGKRVAVAEGTSGNELLLAALKHAGLTWSDITPVYLQPADALAALKSGSIDAWSVWYPFVSLAEQEGAKVIQTGASLDPGYDFIVSTPSALGSAAKSKAIGEYLDRLKAAQRWADAHPSIWSADYARLTGIAPSVAAATEQQEIDAHYLPISSVVVQAEQQLADGFASIGLIKKVDVSSIFDDRYSAELTS